MNRRTVHSLLALLLASAAVRAADLPHYNIVDLGAVFGSDSVALGLSDSGYVVGWSGFTGVDSSHAFIWSGGTMMDLGIGSGPGGPGPSAQFSSVNNSGFAVGWTKVSDGRMFGYYGQAPNISTNYQPTLAFSNITAISNSGYFAHTFGNLSRFGARQSEGFSPPGPTEIYLGSSDAWAVNERGNFGGTLFGGTFNDPYVWHGNDPLLTGANPSFVSTIGDPGVRGLNDNYQAVIGQIDLGVTDYLWNYRTGALTSLDTGDNRVGWFDVNNRGEVVGYSTPGAAPHAMLYRDGSFIDLNTVANPGSGLYHLADAHAINDKGWIVGTGWKLDGHERAYLAIPDAQPGLVNNQDFSRGDLIGWSPKGGGIADSVAVAPGDYAAKLQIWTDPYLGHQAILDQYLDTFASPYSLDFDYQFRTTTGVLKVSLEGVLLDTLNAPGGLPGGFVHWHFDITNPALRNRNDILLDFNFDGVDASQVWLDNVSLTAVPEPSTLSMGGIGLAVVALGVVLRRGAGMGLISWCGCHWNRIHASLFLACAFVFAVSVSLENWACAADLYVSNGSLNTIQRFGPTGNDLGTFASTGLSEPEGLAFNSSGNLFVANFNDNTIHEFGPTGNDLGTFASTGLTNPAGVAFDSSGNLFVANYNDRPGISEFGPTGTDLGTFGGSSNFDGAAVSLAFDSNGNLAVASTAGNVLKFDPTTWYELSAFVTNNAIGIAFDSSGNLLVVNPDYGTIEKFDPTLGYDLGTFASVGGYPQFLAFAPVPEPSTVALGGIGLVIVGVGVARRRRVRIPLICWSGLAILSLASAAAQFSRAAEIVDLGDFKANAINNAGQIAGTIPHDPFTQAAVWHAGSVMPLTTDGHPLLADATAINNAGELAGSRP